jgi:hypothetical protein
MSISKFIWGLFFIGLGVLFLGSNLGWWGYDIFKHLVYFWPIILVLIGLRFIIRDDTVYGVIFLILVAGVVWAAATNPYDIRSKMENNNGKTESENIVDENKSNLTKATMTVNIGAAKMIMNGEAEDDLFHLRTENMGKIETNRNDVNGVSTVTIRETEQNLFQTGFSNRRFELELSDNIPLELTLNNGASSLEYDFSDVLLSQFNLNTGASSGTIKFGSKVDQLNGQIKAGASDLIIFVPKGYGVKVNNSSALTSLKTEGINLTKNDKIYESSDYSTNTKKITLELSSGATSITIKQY